MIISLITLLAASPAAAQDCDDGVAIDLQTPTGKTVEDIDNDASDPDQYLLTAFPGRYVGIGQHVVLTATYPDDTADTGDSPSMECDPDECHWLIVSWNEAKGGFGNCEAPGAPGKSAIGQDVCGQFRIRQYHSP